MQESTLSKAAAELGRRGGSAKTAAKKAASAKNGQLGGRPRDKKPSAAALAQRRSRARRAKQKSIA